MADSINKILVVDEDPVILKSVEIILRPEGYVVEGVPGNKDAMELMKRNNYNLVLTALGMSEANGIALIKWIRKFQPSAGIVVLAGEPLPETIKEALSLGIIDYITKPFTSEQLKDAADKAIKWISGNALETELKKEFPASMLVELDKAINQYRKKPGSVIMVLLQAQEIFGYLPSVVLRRIARGLNVYPAEIDSIVSAYSCFRTGPGSGHTPCYVKGSERVMRGMTSRQGVFAGGKVVAGSPKVILAMGAGRRVANAINEYLKWRHGESKV